MTVSYLDSNSNRNVGAIADYISRGESSENKRRLGLEIEHFVVDAHSLQPIPYSARDARDAGFALAGIGAEVGVEDLLEALMPLYDGRSDAIDVHGNPRPIGLAREGAPLSLEPGAQLEVSMGPSCTVAELAERYSRFRLEADPILADMGCRLVTLGYHPTACAGELPLIPKHRYEMMDRYFKSTGRHGICMMRGSASAQVSIDFTDEADCIAKARVATAIGPLLYFLCDNSPIFEGRAVGVLGDEREAPARSGLPIPQRMARASIWEDVDADRSMSAPSIFDEDAGYASYARGLMQRPLILTLADAGDDSTAIYHGPAPACKVYSGREMSIADIEHLLSMFFFDVRLKHYVEIRMADSMPAGHSLALAAMMKGLFYDAANLVDLVEMTSGVDATSVEAAKKTLARDGYGAVVYGMRAAEWLDELMGMARRGLSRKSQSKTSSGVPVESGASAAGDKAKAVPAPGTCLDPDEQAFLDPIAQLVSERTTLLDLAATGALDDPLYQRLALQNRRS